MKAQICPNLTQTLSLPQAAKQIGKSETTLRNWIKKGFIEASQDTNGCWLIERNVLLNFASTEAQQHASHTNTLTSEAKYEPQESHIVELYREALERERRVNDDLREQNKRLESEIFKLTHEIQAFLTNQAQSSTIPSRHRVKTTQILEKSDTVDKNIIDNKPYIENTNLETKLMYKTESELNNNKTWYSAKHLADLLKMNPKYLKVRCKELGFESRINHEQENRVEFLLNQEQFKKFIKNNNATK